MHERSHKMRDFRSLSSHQTPYLSALTMDGQWRSQLLHPESAQMAWLDLAKNSFLTKIMTPVTSYLVVENEAQKAVLRKKQAQVLANNKSLDLGEEQRMSEPGLWLLMVLLGIFLWYRTRQQRLLVLILDCDRYIKSHSSP